MPVVNSSGTLLGYLKYRDPIRAAQAGSTKCSQSKRSHGHGKYSHSKHGHGKSSRYPRGAGGQGPAAGQGLGAARAHLDRTRRDLRHHGAATARGAPTHRDGGGWTWRTVTGRMHACGHSPYSLLYGYRATRDGCTWSMTRGGCSGSCRAPTCYATSSTTRR